jgi:hypothetical protein
MRPDRHLGSPPSGAAAAGRMNARGISVFYGANDPRVALAEVRPPVGSRVAVARFEIIRPLRLLDLTALSDATVEVRFPAARYHLTGADLSSAGTRQLRLTHRNSNLAA